MADDTRDFTTKPKAYSYLRFSTPEQIKGDSFRRQAELSRQYALEHDLRLDEVLTFHDLGVSAFTGKNVTDGKLGAFLRAVDNGLVLAGSYLLVESLDRLSRQQLMPALGQLQDILERDIIVVTLSDGHRYTRGSLNNPMELMASLMVMSRAHEESATKAKRVAQAWANKRKRAIEEGHKLTASCPAWLTLSADRKSFKVNEKRAEVVRRIFDLILEGHGKAKIASMFNEEGVPTFNKSKGWHDSYIARIVKNEAVIGAFQPKRRGKDEDTGSTLHTPDGPPIEDYFPAVVNRTTFLKVKAGRLQGPAQPGSRGKGFSNLFAAVAFCAKCGAAMRLVNKGGGRGEDDKYYACSGALRKHSDCKSTLWRYPALEYGVLMCLRGIQYTDVFPEIHQKDAQRIKQWQDRRLELEDDLDKTKRHIDTAMDLLLDTPSASLKSRLMELDARKIELEAELKDIDKRITTYQHHIKGITSHVLADNVEALLRWFRIHEEGNGNEEERYALRARMNALLKQRDVKVLFELAGAEPDVIKGKVHGRIGVRIEDQKMISMVVMRRQKIGHMELMTGHDVLLTVPLSRDAADDEAVVAAEKLMMGLLREIAKEG